MCVARAECGTRGYWSCPPTLRRLEVLAHRDEFLNLSKYLVIYEQECVWSGPGGWSGVADVGEGCGRCQMSVCEECSARVCARYGLRGMLVGEASNPGPQRSSSRTPTRGGVAEAMEYQQFFADAQRSLGLRIDHLFVPRGMLSDNRAPAWVGANDDVEAMKGAFRTDGTVWVHGSQSTAYRTLLRERSVRQCVVSDIVRSDTGILAEKSHALAAPIGALSSDLFCRSMQSLVVVDRVGGWQDHEQKSSGTFLFAFRCGKPGARITHDVEISRVDLVVAEPEAVVLPAVVIANVMRQLVVESQLDLACICQWQFERRSAHATFAATIGWI